MSSATSPNTDSAAKSRRPLSAFEWMEKYRIPILLACLLALVGFGAWGAVHDWLQGARSTSEIDPNEVIATYELGGKKHEITWREFWSAQGRRSAGSEEFQDLAEHGVSAIIRNQMVQELDIPVSDKELEAAIRETVIDPIKQQNDGKLATEDYVRAVNRFYRMPVEKFEQQYRESLRTVKMLNELSRAPDEVSTQKIFEQYKKQFQKIKVKGVFFSTESFKDAAKLPVEKNEAGEEVLTKEGREKLEEWWKKLDDARRKTFAKGGAALDVEGLGFRFAGKTDAEIDAEFNRENPISKTSLAKLTEGFTPTEADLEKLKLRFGRLRAEYGVPETVTDIDKELEARKPRLLQEWKIWKLLKKLHGEIEVALQAGQPVDFKTIADSNNLTAVRLIGQKLDAIVKHPDYPGLWANQLTTLNPAQLLTWRSDMGPAALSFDGGPVDEPAKHVSIWRFLQKADAPAVLADSLKEAREAYEIEQQKVLRDAAIKAFEDKMDAVMSEKAKEFADKARAEAATAIAEETKSLNAETDKARIAEITKQKQDEAEARIKAEKEKYRTEAFDAAAADPTVAPVVVEEGFFKPGTVTSEQVVDKDRPFIEKARSALRREFRALHDNAQADTVVALGTVSPATDSTLYPGIRGIAKLIEKKEPTIQDMFLNPMEMFQAENALKQKARQAQAQQNLWTWDSMKRVFKLEAKVLEDKIAEDVQRRRQQQEDNRRWEEEHRQPPAIPTPPPTLPTQPIAHTTQPSTQPTAQPNGK
jgi:hypothetical protein